MNRSALRLFWSALMVFGIASGQLRAGDKERLIHYFPPRPNGFPESALTADSMGNLYGTVYGSESCPNSCGLVFELTPTANGQFNYKMLHTFVGGNSDGTHPMGPLAIDGQGNVYGTTVTGGTGTACIHGCGTVFEISPAVNGSWVESVLYSFQGGYDAAAPESGVILDSSGNIYGASVGGGNSAPDPVSVGTVFELTSTGSGWSESLLYVFKYNTGDGNYPWGLTFDADGNLWGVTALGGSGLTNCPFSGCGTVYELKRSGESWVENIVYSFQAGTDGYQPVGKLVFDTSGNIYGTSWLGGTYGNGIIFQLTPSGGTWTEQILYTFTGGTDGGKPFSGLTPDQAGNFYGTTENGGATCSCGTVYELSPNSNGGWTQQPVHTFTVTAKDGRTPIGNIVFGPQGDLYGTTYNGGPQGAGTVYLITP